MTCTFWNYDGCTISEGSLDFRGEPEVGHPEECRYFVPKEKEVVVTIKISQRPSTPPNPPKPKSKGITRQDVFERVSNGYVRDTDYYRSNVYSWISGLMFGMQDESDLTRYIDKLSGAVYTFDREEFLAYARKHLKT